jgi:predicted NBD/HSP70 family sugar kinase
VNREAVRGSTANAGDAGHITVDPSGTICVCGRAGCVGDLITPRSLVQQAIAAGVLPPLEPDADDPTDMAAISRAFHRLAECAGSGQPAAQLILRTAGLRLARAIVVLVNLLDLDEIVFGGPFWDEIGDALLAVLPAAVETDPALIPKHSLLFDRSSIGEDVAAVGAACLVLDYAFSPRPSAMLISV